MGIADKPLAALNKWLETQPEVENREDMEKRVNQFVQLYNNELKNEVTVYDLLEQAEMAVSETECRKIIKQALVIDPDFIEAKQRLIEIEAKSFAEAEPKLLDLLEDEKRYLKREKIYIKENIGHFYEIFESRPFMRILYSLLIGYVDIGKYDKARTIAEEMLRLNVDDNLGVRYVALGVYACLNNTDAAERLVCKYADDYGAFWWIPQVILAFKQKDDIGGQKAIRQLHKDNKYALGYLRGEQTISRLEKAAAESLPGYIPGSIEEAILAIENNKFAIPNKKAFYGWVDKIASIKRSLN